MTVTDAMLAKLRRTCALSDDDATYTDDILTEIIEEHKCFDDNGEDPTYLDKSTEPPTVTDNDNWIPTYDLYAAAADVWEEKAATLQSNFDFSADGGNYKTSQAHDNALKMAAKCRSRSRVKTIDLIKNPKEGSVLDDQIIYRGFD
jgi:hypothetical protein